MRIVYITAGAAGGYCGSCMRDNTLVAALCRLGCDAMLVPTYTPIRTDEEDVSEKRVFFGGINVYLQQKLRLFRWTPWFLDRLFDFPRLLRWVSRFAVNTKAEDLGSMTVSMLKGENGNQRKEVKKIVRWLANDIKPQVVNLTNALLSGVVHDIREELDVPILCSLQGDDIFTEALPEPDRSEVLGLIQEHCKHIDGFVSTSASYADFMADYFAIPREKIQVIYPGIKLTGHGEEVTRTDKPYTVGYFARICPEKGLHNLSDAFAKLKRMPGTESAKLRISGYFSGAQEAYLAGLLAKLRDAGHADDVEHVDSPSHSDKVRFLQSIDVLSVPTDYREPKGLFVLEAMANGIPVVQPGHGSFPELIEQTGGGLLVPPGDTAALADALHRLGTNPEERAALGRQGKATVFENFHDERMARETLALYEEHLRAHNRPKTPVAG